MSDSDSSNSGAAGDAMQCTSYQLGLEHSALDTSSICSLSTRATDLGEAAEEPVAMLEDQEDGAVIEEAVVMLGQEDQEDGAAIEEAVVMLGQEDGAAIEEAVVMLGQEDQEDGYHPAWDHLNEDVLQSLFQKLSCEDAIAASGVCTHWRAVALKVLRSIYLFLSSA
jgi:hypothetical protein